MLRHPSVFLTLETNLKSGFTIAYKDFNTQHSRLQKNKDSHTGHGPVPTSSLQRLHFLVQTWYSNRQNKKKTHHMNINKYDFTTWKWQFLFWSMQLMLETLNHKHILSHYVLFRFANFLAAETKWAYAVIRGRPSCMDTPPWTKRPPCITKTSPGLAGISTGGVFLLNSFFSAALSW